MQKMELEPIGLADIAVIQINAMRFGALTVGDRGENNQFYFEGKYFDKEDDFWAYTKEWQTFPLDQETAERKLNTLKKEIFMNMLSRGLQFNNIEFNAYVNKIFEFAMNELMESYTPKECLKIELLKVFKKWDQKLYFGLGELDQEELFKDLLAIIKFDELNKE